MFEFVEVCPLSGLNDENVRHHGIHAMGSIKKGSIKRAVIVGATSGLVVSLLSDLDPAIAILIAVACGIGVDRIIQKIWPLP